MEVNLKLIVLLVGVLCTGLTSGLCFTWSNAVTPGIGSLDDLSFLNSFQAMNRSIINGKFLFVFFSPTIILFINTWLQKNSTLSFWLFLSAALLYFVGLFLVTILGNVPLNEILDKTNLDSLSTVELKSLRTKFEQPWNQWHTVRSLTSLLSFILLLIGMMYTK
jgi:uncharacterized membrane protein